MDGGNGERPMDGGNGERQRAAPTGWRGSGSLPTTRRRRGRRLRGSPSVLSLQPSPPQCDLPTAQLSELLKVTEGRISCRVKRSHHRGRWCFYWWHVQSGPLLLSASETVALPSVDLRSELCSERARVCPSPSCGPGFRFLRKTSKNRNFSRFMYSTDYCIFHLRLRPTPCPWIVRTYVVCVV